MTPPSSIFIARKPSARRAVDPDVRALLREYLDDLHQGTDTVVLEELGLCQGDVRVDVASVNGELSGYEIKSPSDTLARFPNQCRIYSKVVDRAWLVATEKTLAKAAAPDWWGLIAVFDAGDRLGLRVVRAAQLNPKPDAISIAKLLWRDEALECLRNAGRARGVMTKSRKVIWKRLIECVELEDLRAAVRDALKRRPEMIELCGRKSG
ncbi:MAG: sce7726 family protein [Cyanobacteria bacterium]|nr:sce7726 family protein [Cyanobacteriota bacterium]